MRHDVSSWTRFLVDAGRFDMNLFRRWVGSETMNGKGIFFGRRRKERAITSCILRRD